MRWMGHVALTGEIKVTCTVLVGKSEGKRLLGRPSLRGKDRLILNGL
jgi:hypothetical protein